MLSAGQRITDMSDSYLGRKPLKLIKQGNERFTHDRSAFDVLSLTLFLAMFCSQIAMSRMHFDFQQRGSRISSLQQIFFLSLRPHQSSGQITPTAARDVYYYIARVSPKLMQLRLFAV